MESMHMIIERPKMITYILDKTFVWLFDDKYIVY